MAASDAVKILVDGLTDGGTIHAAGEVVFEPSEALLACAEEKRTRYDGVLLCKKLSKSEALRAAKAADDEDEDVVEPLAEVPVPEDNIEE